MDSHIFIDNSNMYGGAQRAAGTNEPAALWMAVRLYYRSFFLLIEGSDTAITRMLGGSVPPGNDALWQHARDAGYNTDLLKRVENDSGNLVEQGVDEVMHLKIANVLLDYEPPQKLIICTGDGNESDFGTSFLQQAKRALKRGWHVDVWSWKDQLSGKFDRLRGTGSGTLTVNELDNHYWYITFVRRGTYFVGTTPVAVADRIVHAMP
ncbi:MAG: NYN domain-containing protein [Chloroflexi bacterium]|nr:NYN domain-containing protein [Chloroflexota bacterium]